MPWWYLTSLVAANLALLLPNASPLRVAGALLLIGLLPGLGWAKRFLSTSPALLRWTTAFGLSYVLTTLTTLLLHYLPGPVHTWQLPVALDILALLPLIAISNFRLITRHQRLSSLFLPRITRIFTNLFSFSCQFVQFVAENLSLFRRCRVTSFRKARQLRGIFGQRSAANDSNSPAPRLPGSPALYLVLLIALLLRTANLHYSEFQGDEALAMIAAAEALEGHEDALFFRAKGPAEVLIPMALWRLAGTINEPIARLPFTIAALMAIVTIFLIGRQFGGQRVGWLAAGFFAFNGFMVAFGRIVQYQALVVWMSALAFLMMMHWRQTGQHRFALLSGLYLGAGLLSHYDAILVSPALAWLLVTPRSRQPTVADVSLNAAKKSGLPTVLRWRRAVSAAIKPGLLLLVAFLLTALAFYLPFALDPQANRTGEYVGGRIGNELRNNLPDFFHFNTFYSSAYYLFLTGLLVLGVLAWFIWQTNGKYRWAPVLLVMGVLAVAIWPDLPTREKLDLSIIPFALLLLGAFLALARHHRAETRISGQSLIVWLAVPFLGYNFIVALGLTHIYTIVPAWSLLAALGWDTLFEANQHQRETPDTPFGSLTSPLPGLSLPSQVSNVALILLAVLSTTFLWNAFIRTDLEYLQDYPAGNLSLYWTPYVQPPQAGFFGFVHRAGWKAVGQQLVAGELKGDYGSNEEPDVTTWYTRGAPRACDPHPEYYFLASDLVDPIAVPDDVIFSSYDPIGSITLPNQKQMKIMQQRPTGLTLGALNEPALARDFDRTATPAAFARSAQGSIPIEANFGNLVRLIGYDLDLQRAYPGGRLPVTLYWQALTQLSTSYQVFTHLEGNSGPVAQADGVPVCWSYPTDRWRPGQIIADRHAILIPAEISPGTYSLEIGLYLPDTFERLELLDIAGNPAGVSLTLTEVSLNRD